MQWEDYAPGDDHLRGAVMHAIEEASGRPMHVTDPLPDELLAAAQAEGIGLMMLQFWIYSDKRGEEWSAPAFIRWTRAIERVSAEFRALREART